MHEGENSMENAVAIVALLVICGLAIWYIVRAKKRGEKCIGCPYAKECAKKNGGAPCGGNG